MTALVGAMAVGFSGQASAGSIGIVPDNGCLPSSTGTIFCDADNQPTGTGVFDPFMRVFRDQANKDGTPATYSSGWNTDANKGLPESNDAPATWNHSLLLADLGTVNLGGQDYYLFTVDINQEGAPGEPDSLIDLVNFELFNCSTNNYKVIEGTGATCSLFFDAFAADEWVTFDYHNQQTDNHGSGSGDINVYVPVSNVAWAGPYIALRDGWGTPPGTNADNDGYQEWQAMIGSTDTTDNTDITDNPDNVTVTPEPTTLVLFGSGLAIGASRLRRRKKA